MKLNPILSLLTIVLLSGAFTYFAGIPVLPESLYPYENLGLPSHFENPTLDNWDNTPSDNEISDAGATLGRVLFYDVNLSQNNAISCASCHKQEFAFSDPDQFSTGFEGGLTGRNSMSLVNVKYYEPGSFFWDERAATLEDQTLMPIQHPVEMGMDLATLVAKLEGIEYYDALFVDAFGDSAVSSDRISKALAQFVRSMISFRSKYDQGIVQVDSIEQDFPNYTAEENLGKAVFLDRGKSCIRCHFQNGRRNNPNEAYFADNIASNNGIDASLNSDNGKGDITGNPQDNGVFKSPSLRNIMITAPYMHDGRFETIEEVLDHYQSGIQLHPNLDSILIRNNGLPRRINFSDEERSALVAFFHTLTDEDFQNDVRWSDPFNNIVFPVELLEFYPEVNDNSIVLKWSTSSEIQNDRFELERSIDGLDFVKIATISGQVNSSDLNHYSYEDRNVTPGIDYYYRIRQIDVDGNFSMSKIISGRVLIDNPDWEISPNPARDYVNVYPPFSGEQTFTFSIVNRFGKLWKNEVVTFANKLKVSIQDLPRGFYFFTFQNNTVSYTEKVMVRK
jgi:cytochrome c peroxidase